MGQYKNTEGHEVDVRHVAKALLRRWWIIVLCTVLAAAIGFSLATFFIKPSYSSTIRLYINNLSSSENSIINSSQIEAAHDLVDTYCVILNSNSVYDEILQETGMSFSTGKLSNMISAGSVNETEVMYITVTSKNPDEAFKIAKAIEKVFTAKIEDVMVGATAEVIDPARLATAPSSPNIKLYTILGALLGLFLSCGTICMISLLDNKIHDDDYIADVYQYPLLAKIPAISQKGYYGHNGYYGKNDK